MLKISYFLIILLSYLLFPVNVFSFGNKVPVLVVGVVDPTKFDRASVLERVKTNNTLALEYLNKSSAYKLYKDPTSINYLDYEIIEEVYFYEPVLKGLVLKPNQGTYRPDYNYYLNKIDVCDYVDNKSVRQVWFWTQHDSEVEPVESNMSMGITVSNYWNFQDYGDVSNSERTNDLPICDSSYALFNYNFERGVGEMLENHTHHLEHVYNFLDGRETASNKDWPALLFWGKFVGSDVSHKIVNPGCGWTHYPPNGTKDYDWYNKTPVLSDCEDWSPSRIGQKKMISCITWSGNNECPDDGGVSFKVWWMQNLPGYNNGLSYNNMNIRNFWDAVLDFDAVLSEETGLLTLTSPSPYPSNTPVLTPTAFPSIPLPATPTESGKYDLDNNGSVDLFDLLEIIKYLFR